jgi:hypothetical protein
MAVSITAVLFFKQAWCPLIVGCMLWSVVPGKPVLLLPEMQSTEREDL